MVNMNRNSNVETIATAIPEQNVIAAMLMTAFIVTFTEGHPPYAMIEGNMVRLDVPSVTREDIDNFVRSSAQAEHIEKLESLSAKTKDDYRGGKRWDEIAYSSTTPDYSYRANYHLSMSGATLTIRRIPNRSDFPVRPGNPSDAESPTN